MYKRQSPLTSTVLNSLLMLDQLARSVRRLSGKRICLFRALAVLTREYWWLQWISENSVYYGNKTTDPVSYTHLDVYKRQGIITVLRCGYRTHQSTAVLFAYFEHAVQSCFTERKHTSPVVYDLKNAFNTAWTVSYTHLPSACHTSSIYTARFAKAAGLS